MTPLLERGGITAQSTPKACPSPSAHGIDQGTLCGAQWQRRLLVVPHQALPCARARTAHGRARIAHPSTPSSRWGFRARGLGLGSCVLGFGRAVSACWQGISSAPLPPTQGALRSSTRTRNHNCCWRSRRTEVDGTETGADDTPHHRRHHSHTPRPPKPRAGAGGGPHNPRAPACIFRPGAPWHGFRLRASRARCLCFLDDGGPPSHTCSACLPCCGPGRLAPNVSAPPPRCEGAVIGRPASRVAALSPRLLRLCMPQTLKRTGGRAGRHRKVAALLRRAAPCWVRLGRPSRPLIRRCC